VIVHCSHAISENIFFHF